MSERDLARTRRALTQEARRVAADRRQLERQIYGGGVSWLRLIGLALILIGAQQARELAPLAPPLAVEVVRYAAVGERTELVLLAANPGPEPVELRLADVAAFDAAGVRYAAAGDGTATIPPGGTESVALTFAGAPRLVAIMVSPRGARATTIRGVGR